MPVASTLNKESKADSVMWGCLILCSYQKDGSITASFSFSRSLAFFHMPPAEFKEAYRKMKLGLGTVVSTRVSGVKEGKNNAEE